MGPRMVSVAKGIDNECSKFTIPTLEFFDAGLCGTIYELVSLSQRMISTINASSNLHDHAEVDKIDVPIMNTFSSKERNPLVSA